MNICNCAHCTSVDGKNIDLQVELKELQGKLDKYERITKTCIKEISESDYIQLYESTKKELDELREQYDALPKSSMAFNNGCYVIGSSDDLAKIRDTFSRSGTDLKEAKHKIFLLEKQLIKTLYQTEVFKPSAVIKVLREFLRENVPGYKARHQKMLERGEG